MELYQSDGWVNAQVWFDDPAAFVIALGGRAIGKTFGALEKLTEPERTGKHIYMRRTQSQLDACKIPELNPYKAVNTVRGRNYLLSAMGKYTAGIYNGKIVDGVLKPDGEPRGIGVALSVFANIRGLSGEDYDTVLFDEFIREPHEKKSSNFEGESFLNFYESMNRNRELQGKAPLKCILLSNSNDLASPILDALGVVGLIDKMQRFGRVHSAVGKDISIYLYKDSPISGRKRETALYRVANSEDFNSMALDNNFSRANYENVRSCPLREFSPLVSIGNVTVYSHVNNGSYYVIDGVKAQEKYAMLPNDLKAFRRAYYYLWEALLDKRLFYSSATAKIYFEKVWG